MNEETEIKEQIEKQEILKKEITALILTSKLNQVDIVEYYEKLISALVTQIANKKAAIMILEAYKLHILIHVSVQKISAESSKKEQLTCNVHK